MFFFEKDLLFKIKILNLPEVEKREIIKSIELYNKIAMDFYATGGNPSLIDEIPASKFLKHEIFKEIGYLSSMGFLQVLDLYDFKVKKIDFEDSKKARVEVEEDWNFQRQEFDTRKPLSEIYSFKFEVIYILKKTGKKWIIEEWEPSKY
ncbi:MAG: hypothetical protein WHV67_00460 [Thermoanaerobaculia bacterium]